MPRLMVSFRGTTAPEWARAALRSGEVAAVCLFAYNVVSPAQLRVLALSLHDAARAGGHPPPLVRIDQEGGQLMAVTGGATELPGNMALGAAGRTDLAERAGRVLGLELSAMGCTMDFAPVVDLAHHPDSPVVGLRSFGDDPARAGELAAALIRGMQSAGVIATAKHFPGHGATATDSHHVAPRIERSRRELEDAELVPFRAAIAAGVGAIMTAHASYPALDEEVPATLSRPILTGLLREELGFRGLVVSDATDMGAVAHLSPERRCAAALAAGNDLVLLGHLEQQAELIRILTPAFGTGAGIGVARPVGRDDAASSLARIDAARRALPTDLPAMDLVGCREHRELAQEIADAAVTVLRRGPAPDRLPLRPLPGARIAVITVQAGDLTPTDTSSATSVRLAAQIAARHGPVADLTLPYRSDADALARVLAANAGAEHVIVGTVDIAHDARQAQLLRELRQRGQDLVHVPLRSPYDLVAAPFAEVAVCGYGVREANTEAVARVLFGENRARGRLPVELPLADPMEVQSPT